MFSNFRLRSHSLLLAVTLMTTGVSGQTLAIHRNAKNETWIEANSSLDIGYRLQACVGFQEWTDVGDQASGPLLFRINKAGNSERFFRLKTWATENASITLVMIGDSTVADFEANNNWFSGWGQGIYTYFKPNVRVVNMGLAGNSTKVFLTSIEMENMTRVKPDFVLIQFGVADTYWRGDVDQIRTTTVSEYEANLRTIVETIRNFAGTPILITPVNSRIFDTKKKIVPSMQDRCRVVKDLAAEYQTYLIDLNQLSQDLFNKLGESASAYISWSDQDPVHFSMQGAQVIAGLVVNALPNILRPQIAKSNNSQTNL